MSGGLGLLVRNHGFRPLLLLPLHLHADVLGGVVTVHLHQLDDCRVVSARAEQQQEQNEGYGNVVETRVEKARFNTVAHRR